MNDIVIIGAGGFSREVAFLLEEINRVEYRWKILGYVSEKKNDVGNRVGKYSIWCDEETLLQMNISATIGIGDPKTLCAVKQRFQNTAVKFPNLIHQSVIADMDRIVWGQGNIVCPGCSLTTDITIGSNNILNLNCTVGHDVKMGDCCVINPGSNISGGVTIGNNSLIGTGSTILQNISIGEGAIVGAGAVVTKDVKPMTTVVGNPAKPLK